MIGKNAVGKRIFQLGCGAGKSTTVKIMLGLVEGYSGEITIFGDDISDGNVDYKKRIWRSLRRLAIELSCYLKVVL